jgi:hypothetical protein
MSMLSAQCDELRRLASTLDTRYRYADDIATALREAADTIISLRDRAQDLQAENTELRKELESVGMAAYLYGREKAHEGERQD